MQNLFQGQTVQQAMSKSTGKSVKTAPRHQRKGRTQVFAPPSLWGPFVTLTAQFGITGPNANQHVTKINVYFSAVNSNAPFAVEIIGGDSTILTSGPGSATVTITGNVATEIRMRCKSLNVAGQNIIVTFDS